MPLNKGRLDRQYEGSQASGTQLIDMNSLPLLSPLAELMESEEPPVGYKHDHEEVVVEEDEDEETSTLCGSPVVMCPGGKFGEDFVEMQMEASVSCKMGEHVVSNSSTQSGNNVGNGGYFGGGGSMVSRSRKKADQDQMGEKNMYCLARVDEATGLPMRRATLQEAEELCRALAATGRQHLVLDCVGSLTSGNIHRALNAGKRGPVSSGKGGGPCEHCGITESPQWRRGPPTKPVLCNACGTRFRRTGQLSPPQQSPGGKSRQMAKRRWDRKDSREARLVYCEAS